MEQLFNDTYLAKYFMGDNSKPLFLFTGNIRNVPFSLLPLKGGVMDQNPTKIDAQTPFFTPRYHLS